MDFEKCFYTVCKDMELDIDNISIGSIVDDKICLTKDQDNIWHIRKLVGSASIETYTYPTEEEAYANIILQINAETNRIYGAWSLFNALMAIYWNNEKVAIPDIEGPENAKTTVRLLSGYEFYKHSLEELIKNIEFRQTICDAIGNEPAKVEKQLLQEYLDYYTKCLEALD